MTTFTHRLPQQRSITTELPGPRSRELDTIRTEAVPAGTLSTTPGYAADLDGGIIRDVDGNSLIDLASGGAVTGVGASNAAVVEAIREQAGHFTHTAFMITPFESYVRVCQRLNELTPGDHAKRSVLFNTGAEAVENAVKVARLTTGKQAIVAFDHAYHGRTNLTLALTSKPSPYKLAFGPYAPEIYRMPASYPFRDADGVTGEQAAREAIDRIERQIGVDSLAAVIIEPIQGEGGFIVPAPGFLPALADWAKSRGVLFIADEIQTGFARTGDWFASNHEQIVPDLVATAKGIAGGLPLGALTGRADLLDAVHPGGLGGTFAGNPVACAAALATLDFMADNDLPARAREIEAIALPRLQQIAAETDVVGDVRGRGAMVAIEITKPGTKEPDAALTKQIAAEVNHRGVVVMTCGTYGNVIRLLPPLVIPDELLIEGLGVLGEVTAQCAADHAQTELVAPAV